MHRCWAEWGAAVDPRSLLSWTGDRHPTHSLGSACEGLCVWPQGLSRGRFKSCLLCFLAVRPRTSVLLV